MKNKYKILVLVSVIILFVLEAQAQYTLFDHDGITRQYIYYEPTELNEQLPLVFVMHGFTGDANDIKNYSKMNDFADQYGFAVCYPRGTVDSGGNRFWNVGYAFHQNETVNDVGFLTELAVYLQDTHALNPDYTFATGMSNGGEMCYMLACQAYDTFKAVAPVAGMILQVILDECDESPAIPIFEIHGSQDNVTPLSGDPDNNDGWGAYPSIQSTINYFAEKNECTTVVNGLVPNIDTSDNSFIESEKHLNGINENEVWYYKVVGGGHDWPGAWGNMDIEAGQEAWLFFQNYIDANLLNNNSLTIEKSIHIFPNPSNQSIQIETLENLEIIEINLYNTLGVNQKIKLSDKNIDLSNLNSGTYILMIKTLEGIITKKIIRN
ncbi:T9SS type A sorting domain-containing protein [Flavobacteriaceae bacterium]|jgi:polyhydroxybutyrate depolymerase|nr:T9SS type A sorting domain-containing protein [Flavobacteriaceae bacterium]